MAKAPAGCTHIPQPHRSPPGCAPVSHAAVATAPHGLPVACPGPSPPPHAGLGSGLPGPDGGSAASGSRESLPSWRAGAGPAPDSPRPSLPGSIGSSPSWHSPRPADSPAVSSALPQPGPEPGTAPESHPVPSEAPAHSGRPGEGEAVELSAGSSLSTKPRATSPPTLLWDQGCLTWASCWLSRRFCSLSSLRARARSRPLSCCSERCSPSWALRASTSPSSSTALASHSAPRAARL